MKPAVTIIGGGMITHDQLLPSLWQLQRLGIIADITVCSLLESALAALRDSETLRRAFPDRSFIATTRPYAELLAQTRPRGIVVVAVPDQVHFDAVMRSLEAEQHVCCVKPLVLTVRESRVIEEESFRRGLFVGIEYHKRFDDRSLMARRRYRDGMFGHFRLGSATMMEKWYYRESNFQNWMTVENSDAFTYVGCHYVDLVHFITGLLPAAISVYGVRDRYPNGNEGFLWTDARVLWNNGACLNVQNTLSFPDEAPGSNTQGLTMYCSDGKRGGLLRHDDQYRGLQYSYVEPPTGPGATAYAEPSPDYFQYVGLGGEGLTPVGYGYRSVEAIVRACLRVEASGDLRARQAVMKQIDDEGVLATPSNSRYNEFVTEAARMSILNGAREVVIDYERAAVSFG
ncbi:MAG TPA: Gfo/Idh/MocA family oxidoreductase [Bryobacteraceae bacterium]|nr:Gfo/Idh/MocA family oxidoreductase [Bryobacteraceae bacterium]